MAYERKTYDIFISDDLKEILTEFESESVVAQLLLKRRHDKEDLVENPVNFISISRDDRTKISYLTPDRMQQINPSEFWTSTRRFQTKPGAFISKLFSTKNISSREVEKFANLFRSQAVKPKFEFKVVSGWSIKQFYHYDSYQSDRGTLGASCMKHESCQRYLDFYVDNTDKVSMLVMIDGDGYLMGRALLWKFDSYKIMDRIYTVCDEDLSFYFKQWATQNGFLYKSEQNWYNTMQFEQVGQKRQELKLEIQFDNLNYDYFPYMDTFKFLDRKSNKLYNYQAQTPYLKTLCSSEGVYYDGDYLRFDGIDRVLRYQGDSAWVSYLNLYTHQNNVSWSDINNQYILNKDVEYCNEINEPIFNKEYDHLNDKVAIEQRKKEIEKFNSQRIKRKGKIDLTNVNISDLEGLLDSDEIRAILNRNESWDNQFDQDMEPDMSPENQ